MPALAAQQCNICRKRCYWESFHCADVTYYVSEHLSLTFMIGECISCTDWKLSVINFLFWIVLISNVERHFTGKYWYETSSKSWEGLELVMVRFEYYHRQRVFQPYNAFFQYVILSESFSRI